MRIATVQNAAQHDLDKNLNQIEHLISTAVTRDHADMVVLTETFALRAPEHLQSYEKKGNMYGETLPDGVLYTFLKKQATKYGIWIHGGSLNERDGSHRYNTTLVFTPRGEMVAKYRKVNLFDFVARDGTVYAESDIYGAGQDLVTYQVGDLTFGCTICYDLRFPDLFMAYARAGVDVIVVPACFTLNTTRDHWEKLLVARAIDTQCYMVGCNQLGALADGTRPTGGRSCVVDPWGTVTSMNPDEVGVTTAYIDKARLKSVREKLKTAQIQKPFNAPHNESNYIA